MWFRQCSEGVVSKPASQSFSGAQISDLALFEEFAGSLSASMVFLRLPPNTLDFKFQCEHENVFDNMHNAIGRGPDQGVPCRSPS